MYFLNKTYIFLHGTCIKVVILNTFSIFNWQALLGNFQILYLFYLKRFSGIHSNTSDNIWNLEVPAQKIELQYATLRYNHCGNRKKLPFANVLCIEKLVLLKYRKDNPNPCGKQMKRIQPENRKKLYKNRWVFVSKQRHESRFFVHKSAGKKNTYQPNAVCTINLLISRWLWNAK